MDASFLLNTAVSSQDFVKQKTFLKLTAAKFNLSTKHRLSVSVYKEFVSHPIPLGSLKDNRNFANAVDNLNPFKGEYRLDVALQDVLQSFYPTGRASLNAKLIVPVVSHELHRSSNFCPSYIQPFELTSKLKAAGVRVIMAVIGVNTSEYVQELIDSKDEVWYFHGYEQLVSAAGNFSVAICRAAGKYTVTGTKILKTKDRRYSVYRGTVTAILLCFGQNRSNI